MWHTRTAYTHLLQDWFQIATRLSQEKNDHNIWRQKKKGQQTMSGHKRRRTSRNRIRVPILNGYLPRELPWNLGRYVTEVEWYQLQQLLDKAFLPGRQHNWICYFICIPSLIGLILLITALIRMNQYYDQGTYDDDDDVIWWKNPIVTYYYFLAVVILYLVAFLIRFLCVERTIARNLRLVEEEFSSVATLQFHPRSMTPPPQQHSGGLFNFYLTLHHLYLAMKLVCCLYEVLCMPYCELDYTLLVQVIDHNDEMQPQQQPYTRMIEP